MDYPNSFHTNLFHFYWIFTTIYSHVKIKFQHGKEKSIDIRQHFFVAAKFLIPRSKSLFEEEAEE